MANTAGDWEIARHVTALLELLEANPEFSKSFLNGDGRIGMTILGYTIETFEDRPTTFFAAPFDGEAEGILLVSSARKACKLFFDGLERTPSALKTWKENKHELAVRPSGAKLRRQQ